MTEEQKQVYEALMAYHGAHKGDTQFVASDFVAHMEPVFQRNGFRYERGPGAWDRRSRILVLRDDAAGDFILFSPFLRELRRLYPTAHITLFASDRNYELAQHCPYVDAILINDIKYKSGEFWDVFEGMATYAAETLLPQHFDLAFSGRLGIRSGDVLLMYMGGARTRIGYTQDRPSAPDKIVHLGWDVLMSIPLPLHQRLQSDVDRNLFLLEGLLMVPIANRHTEVWSEEGDREAAKQAVAPLLREKRVKRIYAVMTFTSQSFREWPLERFEAFFKWLLKKEKDVGLLMLGGQGDKQRAEALAAKFPHRALSVAGQLSFRASAEAIGLCEKYIGDDTGLAHAAAAKGVPVLDIFPFPASLQLHPLSCPVRFQPYGVPAVSVLPPAAAEEKCRLATGTGCADHTVPHCILGVTVKKFQQGYELLEKCIKEKRKHALIIK